MKIQDEVERERSDETLFKVNSSERNLIEPEFSESPKIISVDVESIISSPLSSIDKEFRPIESVDDDCFSTIKETSRENITESANSNICKIHSLLSMKQKYETPKVGISCDVTPLPMKYAPQPFNESKKTDIFKLSVS